MLHPPASEASHAYQFTLPERRREGHMWLQWLIRLRWIAIAAQVITLSFAYKLLASPTLIAPLVLVIAILVIANAHATRLLEDPSGEDIGQPVLLNELGLDVLALTTFFFLAGGPSNPFTMLYLVHIAMGMMMMHAGYAVGLTVWILLCYGALQFWSLPLNFGAHSLPEATLMQLGQVLAFTVTVVSVGGFVLGMANSLRAHQARARERGEGPLPTEEAPIADHGEEHVLA